MSREANNMTGPYIHIYSLASSKTTWADVNETPGRMTVATEWQQVT